ncbi:MAG TPA: hypothetical protein DEO49_05205 [Sutterella sp.]|jgi:hypothetical protein|nr:hypothetical protein [Sutterella sp.]
MTGKKVGFGGSRPSVRASTQKMDAWVSGQQKNSETIIRADEKMKRLSLDLTATMHRDLMTYCIAHDTKASDLLRDLIAKKIY